jgi:hypothetical protein
VIDVTGIDDAHGFSYGLAELLLVRKTLMIAGRCSREHTRVCRSGDRSE